MTRRLVIVGILCVLSFTPAAARAAKQADPEAVRWFEDAKFGLFVHWGIYCVHGKGEWAMHHEKIAIPEYEKLAGQFNPVKFDPAEWVRMVKGAGMRYITITAKHHDGFAMYDSKVSDYDVIDRTPYKRDILKMLADECAKQDVKLFFYYSPLDWHHADYVPVSKGSPPGRPAGGDWDKYKEYYIAQVAELTDGRYGKIAGIWFDGWWDNPKADWALEEVYERIHTAQPQALVGNNHHRAPFPGEDFQMFEQDLPGHNQAGFNKAAIAKMPLEMCLTMNNTWGYNKTDHKWKSAKECLHLLVKAAGLGSNLLLNVGPMPDGTIQPEAKERLAEMGAWLKTHGESIYGTRGGPYLKADWGTATQGDDTIYLHVLSPPKTGKLELSAPSRAVAGIRTLVGNEKVRHSTNGNQLQIELPKKLDAIDTVLVVALAKNLQDVRWRNLRQYLYPSDGLGQREDGQIMGPIDHYEVKTTNDFETVLKWYAKQAGVKVERNADGSRTIGSDMAWHDGDRVTSIRDLSKSFGSRSARPFALTMIFVDVPEHTTTIVISRAPQETHTHVLVSCTSK